MLKEAAVADSQDVDELVVRSQRGDQQAFNRLIASQYRFIFRVAFRVLGHKNDAEDVTQTVCLRLATSLSSFDHRASFTSWLYRVTMNVARDFLRAQGRRKKLSDGAAVLASEHVSAEQDAQRPVEDIWSVVRSSPKSNATPLSWCTGKSLAKRRLLASCHARR